MEQGKPITYTLYARPLNPQRGNGVRVYLREFTPAADPALSRGRSFFIDTLLDTTIASYELPAQQAEQLVDGWNADQSGTLFSIHPFSRTKHVIRAHINDRGKAERQAINQLPYEDGLGPSFFLSDAYSGSKDVRSTYPSFTIPLQYRRWGGTEHGFVSWTHAPLSLDDTLRLVADDVHLYLDIETIGWDEPGADQRIAMAVMGTNKEWLPKLIFSRYDLGIDRIQDYDIVKYDTDQQLGSMLTERITEYDPLSIGGYNLHFDLIRELRERTKDMSMPRSRRTPSFRPSVEGMEPKVQSASGRTKSVQVHGRFVIDMYNKLSTELSFLPNVKLGTVMHYFKPGFEEGSDFEKGQTYFQLADAFRAAEEGDASRLAAAVEYTANDGDGTLQLMMDQLEEVFVDATTLQRRTESVCKGFAGSSDERWSMEFFRRKGTMLERHRKKYTPRIRPDEEQQVYFTDTELCQRDGQYPRAAFFYPTLLLRACKEIFEAWPDLKAHWEYYEQQGTIRRYRGLRKQQEMMVMPITEYYEVTNRVHQHSKQGFNRAQLLPEDIPPFTFKNSKSLPFDVLDNAFKEAYGNGKVSLRDLNRSFAGHVAKAQALCKPEDIINTNSHFLLLKPEAGLALQEEKLGIILAQGPAVSRGGKAYLAAHNTIYQMGSKLTRGAQSMWENDAIVAVLQESLRHLSETGELDRTAVENAIRHAVDHIPDVERSKLVRKQRRRATDEEKADAGFDSRELSTYYGFLDGREVSIDTFLASERTPDASLYEHAFRKAYAPELEALCQEPRPGPSAIAPRQSPAVKAPVQRPLF